MQCTVWMDGDRDAMSYSETDGSSSKDLTGHSMRGGYQWVSLTGSGLERDAPVTRGQVSIRGSVHENWICDGHSD